MYAGIVLCHIAHLLLAVIYVMRRKRAGCDVLLLPGASPRQVNHSGSRAPPNRNRLGGRWLLDPTRDVQCRGQSPHRFCDHSRMQCARVLLASSPCLLWLYLPLHDLQTKYRDCSRAPRRPIRALTASRQPISELRRSPHPIPPWQANNSNRHATDWPEQKLHLLSLANPQKPN